MNSREIIYPTDFSDCAQNAMAYAIVMDKVLNCKNRILYAVEISALMASEENREILLNSIELLEEQAEKKLETLKERIETFGLECEYVIVKGRTLFLKDYMQKLNPLLIVMGTVGKHGLENKVFGSFARLTLLLNQFKIKYNCLLFVMIWAILA